MAKIDNQIDEMCQMALNSDKPKHWEAGLQDILTVVRKLKEESALSLCCDAEIEYSRCKKCKEHAE